MGWQIFVVLMCMKLCVNIFYDQRSLFASLIRSYKFPYNFDNHPYKRLFKIFKNMYLEIRFSVQFGVFFKVLGTALLKILTFF